MLNKYEVKKGGEFGPSEEYEAADINLRERGEGEKRTGGRIADRWKEKQTDRGEDG